MIYIHKTGSVNRKEGEELDVKAACKAIAPKMAASRRTGAISTAKIKPPSPKSITAKAGVVGSKGGTSDICHGVLSIAKLTAPRNNIATTKAGIRNRLERLPR